jgi:hypothetical protein
LLGRDVSHERPTEHRRLIVAGIATKDPAVSAENSGQTPSGTQALRLCLICMERRLIDTPFSPPKKASAVRFRQRAADCELKASLTKDPDIRRSFEFAAEQWRFLADRAERSSAD